MSLFRAALAVLLLSSATALTWADEPDYTDRDHWLCHPDKSDSDNVCLRDQAVISVAANGSSSVTPGYVEAIPAVDCFYVYPTASMDVTANSNMRPDAQEKDTTAIQFGRYGEVCRTFAPVYRQRTLTYLGIGALGDGLVSEETMATANETAYQDVRQAFSHYLENDSNGRGFLLVGHSQGARLLARLIQEEIETNDELSDRLVAAHLIGTGISVPVGERIGGTFTQTPLCSSANQSGCVVAYSTFRKDDPELATPRFGVVPDGGYDGNYEAACTHPAALAGGVESLHPVLPFDQPYAFDVLLKFKGSGGPYKNWWKNVKAKRQADFYSVPGQFTGECVRDDNGTHYLEVAIDSDESDPRADDYRGELIVVKGWGLHLIDVNLAQGDLIRLAGDQINNWMQR
ncbi:MAG: DUF3089 domain-containing protein [Pseudomonadota bacterium]|nr:DUF3089 domain-containing protein [Pseudomonadota bacterium]